VQFNVVDPFLSQAFTQPKAAALCAPGPGIGLISYGRLANFVNNISRRLRKIGIAPGRVVAIAIQDPIFQVAIMLALTQLGAATVSRRVERSAVDIDALIADEPPDSTEIREIILADMSWVEGDGSPLTPAERPAYRPSDICRIIFTSGSTGTPKAVAFSHGMMFDRIARHLTIFGSRFPNYSRVFCDLPVSTALGYRFLLYTLWRGGTFVFAGETFEQTAEAFEEYRVQCCLSSPGGLEALLRGYERHPALRSELELVVASGDSLSGSLSDRVRARLCAHMLATYGSTEACVIATAPAQAIRGKPGAVGFVTMGVSVEIVDDQGTPMPPGSEGILRIKSPFATDHYAGDPDASAATFRDGWFYPGDLGILDSGNLLRIAGRQDAVLNLGGDKVNPERIDEVLSACPGVIECATFGAPNELGIMQMWAAVAGPVDDASLRAYCADHLPPGLIPAGFVRVDKLVRNDMGKIDRRRLPGLLKRGPAGSNGGGAGR
jgi:acyl-coenzyme A synthetase/AMP-(fatty) acid ligase